MRVADLNDYKNIMETLQAYCKEVAAANIPGLKRVFHQKAVMNGASKTGFLFGPIQNLYDRCEKFGPAPQAVWHIDILDIAGNTAIARVIIKNCRGKNFADFHELVKENGEWKIIAKTFQEF